MLSSLVPNRLSEGENLARALHLRPAAVEFRNQRLQRIAGHGAIERGLIGENTWPDAERDR